MTHRQPRQDRDVRLHDPHAHAHSLPPPPHPLSHAPPHLNGSSIPNTPLAASAAPPPPASIAAASPAVPNGSGSVVPLSVQKLAQANEQTWLLIGRVAEQMGNLEHALSAYENALRHNAMSLPGLTQVAGIARIKENYPKAVEYFQRVLNLQQDNGEVWSALGHCYLMQDDLQKAYAAYQQALYLLPNPKEDPKLWYGIGILYDRYGSLDHAEEAFSSVLRMDKVMLDFDKANEILFRLGIIYKQQGKYQESLECFDRILRNPPNPLAHADIWFQIGHVYEQQHDHVRAREAYERVVQDNPNHAKVLQQLGWLYHQDGSSFQNQDHAIQYLTKSLEADASDAQSWYLLGRAYMAGQKYNKAYEAYQQAVYRDGRNPTFWCSIGVLYFQINQYRDALDAYSRAIRINPYISEVWFDLGSLYESCNNQISDAIDAYARAAELDPSNVAIAQRLALLKNAQATGQALPAAPGPQDVHPTAYANPVMHQPAGLSGPPLMLQSGPPHRPIFRADSRGPAGADLPLPAPPPQLANRSSPGPFGGRPPPPVVLDDNQRTPAHPALAPMDIDRPAAIRESSSFTRDGPRGPGGLVLNPAPGPQSLPAHPHDAFPRHIRRPSISQSPPPHNRLPSFNERPPISGPASHHSHSHSHSRSPRVPYREPLPADRDPRDPAWDRRMPPSEREQREWERDREREREREQQLRVVNSRTNGEYPPPPPPSHPSQQTPYYSRPHSPTAYPPVHHPRGPPPPRERDSSTDASPRSAHPGYSSSRPQSSSYWEKQPAGPPLPSAVSRGRSPSMIEDGGRGPARYDPRFDTREREREREREPPMTMSAREYDREREREREREVVERGRERERELHVLNERYAASPEAMRMRPPPAVPASSGGGSAFVGGGGSGRASESPRMQVVDGAMKAPTTRRRAPGSVGSSNGSGGVAAVTPKPSEIEMSPGVGNGVEKKERRKRAPRRGKEDTPQPPSGQRQDMQFGSAVEYRSKAGSQGSPEPMSSNGSGSGSANRSAQPSPTSSVHMPPAREVDEDYDEGVADALLNMSKAPAYRSGVNDPRSFGPPLSGPPTRSPPGNPRMPSQALHNSLLAGRSSPPNKRPLSPGPDDVQADPKRSRVGSMSRRVSSPTNGASSSTRPSPIPFRQQPTSHSPETRPEHSYPPSPALPTTLPPHPRPIGQATLASQGSSSTASGPGIPPQSTTSPTVESERERDARLRDSRSNSPVPPRGLPAKREIVLHSAQSPSGSLPKGTPSPASSHGSHHSKH